LRKRSASVSGHLVPKGASELVTRQVEIRRELEVVLLVPTDVEAQCLVDVVKYAAVRAVPAVEERHTASVAPVAVEPGLGLIGQELGNLFGPGRQLGVGLVATGEAERDEPFAFGLGYGEPAPPVRE
jgi:hypothetical protein